MRASPNPQKLKKFDLSEDFEHINSGITQRFFLLVGNDYDYLWGGGGADKLNLIPTNHEICKKILKECSVVFNREYFVFHDTVMTNSCLYIWMMETILQYIDLKQNYSTVVTIMFQVQVLGFS